MKKEILTIQIQKNIFIAEQIATTQYDAFGEVLNKWELFSYFPNKIGLKGDLLIGRLFQNIRGEYTVSHFSIGESGFCDFIANYDIDMKDVYFNKTDIEVEEENKETLPEIKPRFLPVGSKVQTTFGVGFVKPIKNMWKWEIEITEPKGMYVCGRYSIVDKDIIKIIELGKD